MYKDILIKYALVRESVSNYKTILVWQRARVLRKFRENNTAILLVNT